MKEAWSNRAEYLNSREVPGKFTSVPAVICCWGKGGLSMIIMEALTVEWGKLYSALWQATLYDRRRVQRKKQKNMPLICFGKESVAIGSQTYQQLNIS